jgi:hypothetical protein
MDRKQETTDIRKYTAELQALDLTKMDGSKLAGNQGVILPSTQNVSPGDIEMRQCHGGRSLLHLLQCGHHVLCAKAETCGSNCQDDDANPGSTALRCALCIRRGMNWDIKHYNKRWQDLLLPTFVKADKEEADEKEFEVLQHPTGPAYLDNHANVVRPVTKFAIALIRALEAQKEFFVEKDILRVCTEALLPSLGLEARKIAVRAQEYLDPLLRFHHELDHLDLRVVATLAICIAADQHNRKLRSNVVLEAFGVDPETEKSEIRHWDAARRLIQSGKAGDVMDQFMEKVHRRYRKEPKFGMLFKTARCLWFAVNRKNVIPKHLLKRFEHVVPVACLAAAASQLGIPISFADVCTTVEVDDKPQEALVIYGKIKIFARGQSWKQRPVKRDDRVKAKQTIEMQNEATKDIDDAMAMLGNW